MHGRAYMPHELFVVLVWSAPRWMPLLLKDICAYHDSLLIDQQKATCAGPLEIE